MAIDLSFAGAERGAADGSHALFDARSKAEAAGQRDDGRLTYRLQVHQK